jgi:HK97 family phage prohead protease
MHKKTDFKQEQLNAEANIEIKDIGDGEIETVISSGTLDRHGEKIDVRGIDTTNYMKNPVVQWAHNYDEPPIGMASKVWTRGDQLIGRFKMAVNENPFAKQIYEMIKAGFISAVSIGFIPLEMEEDTYTKSEMVEFSIVPVPANPEALIYAKKLGMDLKKMGLDKENKTSDNIEDMKKKDGTEETPEEKVAREEREAAKIKEDEEKAVAEAKAKEDEEAKASVKTRNGLAIASVKTVNGLA